MKHKWLKLGIIYQSDSELSHPKLVSHVSNPVAIHVEGDLHRVYFSGRDPQNRSSVGAVDIDLMERKVIKVHYEPVFTHGGKGSFYADGVSIGCCYTANGIKYMLFMGWQSPPGEHWRGDIGRLIINPDLSLRIDSESPFLGVDSTDTLSLSYPWVHEYEDGSFRMWYGSTINWDAGNGEMLHVINTAYSSDGDNWRREGLAVPHEIGVAQAFSRPSVVLNSEVGYEMWFSYRNGCGEKYRIGYAVSKDGLSWSLDLASTGIDVSSSGWDSDMVEYPFVFNHKGETYMLYNGNGFGKSGVGLAVLSQE